MKCPKCGVNSEFCHVVNDGAEGCTMKSVRVRRDSIKASSYRCVRGECLYIDGRGVLWVLRGRT